MLFLPYPVATILLILEAVRSSSDRIWSKTCRPAFWALYPVRMTRAPSNLLSSMIAALALIEPTSIPAVIMKSSLQHLNKCVNPGFHLAFGKTPLIGHVGLDHQGGNADLFLN